LVTRRGGEIGEEPHHEGRVVRYPVAALVRKVVDRDAVAALLETDLVDQEAVPAQGPQEPAPILRPAIGLEETERTPRPLGGGNADAPFRIGILPGSVVALPREEGVGTIDGQIPIAGVTGFVVEPPVRQDPVALGLHVVEGIVPAHDGYVAL